MSKHYEPEVKNRNVRLHLEDGRTLKSLADEYSISAHKHYKLDKLVP